MNVVNSTELRNNMKEVMDSICDRHEPTIITRRKGDDHMILMSLADYNSLEETIYLMRSPNNYKYIMESIEEVRQGNVASHKLIEP